MLKTNKTSLEYKNCSQYDFKYLPTSPSLSKITKSGKSFHLCFNITNIAFSGNLENFDSLKYAAVDLKLKSSLKTKLKEGYFTVNFDVQHKYVDLDDLDNPFKYYYRSYGIGGSELEEFSGYNGYRYDLNRNEIELQDTWWDFLTNPEPHKLLNINSDHTYSHDEQATTQYTVFFILGDQTYQYGRKVLNFLEVTGIVGGLFEILDIFIGIFIGYIYNYNLKREIRRDLTKSEEKIQELEANMKEILRNTEDNNEQFNRNGPSADLQTLRNNLHNHPDANEESKGIYQSQQDIQTIQENSNFLNGLAQISENPFRSVYMNAVEGINSQSQEAQKKEKRLKNFMKLNIGSQYELLKPKKINVDKFLKEKLGNFWFKLTLCRLCEPDLFYQDSCA
ncbi:unnamed protein product [Moneuplotes crassus]|uniref:Uncharacterized protein n=1 Tax=Euplotes crassus TaxID=5936 RepID=A0AAD1U9P0_EUPCR|nr:unnamed protein product [Moneuplotes crassus]